jgi:choline dehydrogenase
MGVPFIKDINTSPLPLPSITKLRTTVTPQGHRSSAAEAFLPASFVQRHKNLTICFGAVVQKIQISLLAGRKVVEGIFVENEDAAVTPGIQGERWFIRGKEVVLCAGAVGSAQLLILRYGKFGGGSRLTDADGSGVGAKEEMDKLGIETKVDLPGVGKHLVSSPSIALIYKLLSSPYSLLLFSGYLFLTFL